MSLQDNKRRRLVCIGIAVALVLLVLLVAVPLGVTLGRKKTAKTFEETFTERCNQFKRNNCETIWRAFEEAYVGKNPCQIPPDAYNRLFEVAPISTPCSKAMFWSKTKDAVHDYVKRNQECFVTMENTLLGSVLDGLTWCGKEGSNETLTEGCPEWAQKDCEKNPVRSFWEKGSAAFAEAACGGATVMLNGSVDPPFDTSSVFGSIEAPKLKVAKLTVVLATPDNSNLLRSNCSNPSFEELRRRLDSKIVYNCKEVKKSQIEQCSSNAGEACTACW